MQGMQSDILQNFHRVCALRSGMTEELIRRANLPPSAGRRGRRVL